MIMETGYRFKDLMSKYGIREDSDKSGDYKGVQLLRELVNILREVALKEDHKNADIISKLILELVKEMSCKK